MLRRACLGHLPEANNAPKRALQTHRAMNGNMNYHVAGRYGAGEWLTV